MPSTHPDFNDYEFDISINVRRREDRYSSEVLAKVSSEEQITLQRRNIKPTLTRLVTDALTKAQAAVEIKHGFELDMLALESGDNSTVDVEA